MNTVSLGGYVVGVQEGDGPRSSDLSFSISAQEWTRASALAGQEFEPLFDLGLSANAVHGKTTDWLEAKWSPRSSATFVILVSVGLWAGIILGVKQLF
jgi:hypothetical protein